MISANKSFATALVLVLATFYATSEPAFWIMAACGATAIYFAKDENNDD